jgi:hypothetical protein
MSSIATPQFYGEIREIAAVPGVVRSASAIGITLAQLIRGARDGRSAGLDGNPLALTGAQWDHVTRDLASWLTGHTDTRPDWTDFPSGDYCPGLMASPAGIAAGSAVDWAWARGIALRS